MTTTTPSTPRPDSEPSLPAGTYTLSDDWADWDNLYRPIYGYAHRVESTPILISPSACQLPDGSIDTTGTIADGPALVMIDELRDGVSYDCLTVTMQGARNLAQALIDAAEEIDGWAAR